MRAGQIGGLGKWESRDGELIHVGEFNSRATWRDDESWSGEKWRVETCWKVAEHWRVDKLGELRELEVIIGELIWLEMCRTSESINLES